MPKKKSETSCDTKSVDMRYGMPKKFPRSKRMQTFFAEYAKGGSRDQAAKAAGYSAAWAKNHSSKVIASYGEYLTWLQAHTAQAVATQIAIDQETVLREVAAVAFANEFDYLVFDTKDGKVVARRKELHELTRDQMRAIRVFRDPGSSPTKPRLAYQMRDRDGKLSELAKHVGLLNEKLILERRHLHLHATFDLSGVPQKELEVIEAKFEAMLSTGGRVLPRAK